MAKQLMNVNNVEICVDTQGDPGNEPLLLITGASASMLWWEEAFVEQLADSGRFVVRMDNRDTGESTCYPPGEPPYTLVDMANDCIAVLDALEIDQAHILGRSMGGMITQHIALNDPDRARSICLIYSSPEGGVASGKASDLPGPLPRYTEATQGMSADADVLESRIALQRVLAGARYPFDEAKSRQLIEREMARARNYASNANHGTAISNTPEWRHRLGEIEMPTLIIHGTDDPILPFPHGEALHAEIAHSSFYVMEGVGHELPEAEWPGLLAEILKHTSPLNDR